MKQKVLAGAVVFVVVAATASYFVLDKSKGEVGDTEGDTPSTSAGVAIQHSESAAPRFSGASGVPLRAVTAVALVEDTQALSPGKAAYFRLQSTQLCSGLVDDNAKAKAGKDMLGQRMLRFCRDFDIEDPDNWPNLQGLDQSDPVVQAYSAADVAYSLATDPAATPEEVKAVTDLLEQRLLQSDGEVEGLVAAEAMQQVGYVAADVRKLSADRGWGFSAAELAQGQVLAAQMASCERIGCGPNDFLTLQICNSLQTCDSTFSLEEAWRRRYGENLMVVSREINKLGQP